MADDEDRWSVFVRGIPGTGKSTAFRRLMVVADETAHPTDSGRRPGSADRLDHAAAQHAQPDERRGRNDR